MGFRMDRVFGLVSWPVFLAGVIAVGCAAQAQTPGGSWEQRTPMPAVRGEVAAAEVGGKIYAFGGFTSSVHQGAGNDRWVTLAPMPAGRHGLGAAVIGSTAYVVGGSLTPGGGGGITDQLITFSLPVRGRLSEGARAPRPCEPGCYGNTEVLRE